MGRVNDVSSFLHWLMEGEYQISMYFQTYCEGLYYTKPKSLKQDSTISNINASWFCQVSFQ
ncbi:hypothetical protein P691DRAFT_801713 [Macrolepiota fuliginosa MF-IS2]|uniref:Uncharacterized protein n=1 Tax=Macrolepiota fuliginosa MF-IS2 TaxID=1400762 RepID=A0A9P5WWZ9_9AGAR|nr:hypothetical protein P691DRAFT_801713 [Macrolepiota fuliginosa MF-IS2]